MSKEITMKELSRDERLRESLRQERETFDQHKSQQERWFNLRLKMGYSALVMLPAILVVSLFIIIKHNSFPNYAVNIAVIALFTDLLGLIISVWKIFLNPSLVINLAPATNWHPSIIKDVEDYRGPNDNSPENELIILSAIYGAEGTTNDVTERLRSKIRNDRLELHVTNYEMGGDPRPKIRKTLTITYIYKGKINNRIISERNDVIIP